MELRTHIRDVPDFPKKGIVFKDITPLLGDPKALAYVMDTIASHYQGQGITKVIGIESRGFIFAAPVALALGVGFAPIRKPGKLPWKSRRQEYALEYGKDVIEIHEDAVGPADRVLMVDDVLATGGTMVAACSLVAALGATLVGCAFAIDLAFLGGGPVAERHRPAQASVDGADGPSGRAGLQLSRMQRPGYCPASDPVAQWIERWFPKPQAAGSNPAGVAISLPAESPAPRPTASAPAHRPGCRAAARSPATGRHRCSRRASARAAG